LTNALYDQAADLQKEGVARELTRCAQTWNSKTKAVVIRRKHGRVAIHFKQALIWTRGKKSSWRIRRFFDTPQRKWSRALMRLWRKAGMEVAQRADQAAKHQTGFAGGTLPAAAI